jgi:hypothetical protein
VYPRKKQKYFFNLLAMETVQQLWSKKRLTIYVNLDRVYLNAHSGLFPLF